MFFLYLLLAIVCSLGPITAEETAPIKHTLLIDFEKFNINLRSSECPFCQKDQDLDAEFTQALVQAGFRKKTEPRSLPGHCYGLTFLFVEFFLKNPPSPDATCAEIFKELVTQPDFFQRAHTLSKNQPIAYFPPPSLGSSEGRIDEYSVAMQSYFTIAFGCPCTFDVVPLSVPIEKHPFPLTEQNIFQALSQRPHQIGILSHTKVDTPFSNLHDIAICTDPERLFIYDSQAGLFRFSDLKSMSKTLSRALLDQRNQRFVSAVFFPMPETK